MNEKEKQIKEMKQDLIKIRTNLRGCYLPQCLGAYENAMAQDLIDLNYRKIPEGSVVIPQVIYEDMKYYNSISTTSKLIAKARKETAKEIIALILERYGYMGILEDIAKQFGVEEQK